MKGGRSKKSVRVEFVMSEQEAELVKELRQTDKLHMFEKEKEDLNISGHQFP